MNIRMRPHHLLCTQSFAGSGYSDEFVANMTAIVNALRGDDSVEVDIVFTTDNICRCCPKKLREGLCASNDRVNSLDQRVAKYFRIKEKSYVYSQIIRKIKEKMTREIIRDICSGCDWYSISGCEEKILKN